MICLVECSTGCCGVLTGFDKGQRHISMRTNACHRVNTSTTAFLLFLLQFADKFSKFEDICLKIVFDRSVWKDSATHLQLHPFSGLFARSLGTISNLKG